MAAWGASRLICWIAGVAAIVAIGADPGNHDLRHQTDPFGEPWDTLVGPFARWDSVWYLRIADDGYYDPHVTNFYPLYGLAARVFGTPVGSSLVGGILVSLAAFLVALYLLHRLVALELGEERARETVLLMAFFPTAVFFSAVYAEGLFIALIVGSFYAARRGRWAMAGILGGLATLARPPGLLLVVPLLVLYLYGPRGDRTTPLPTTGWRPRFRLEPSILWVLAVPAGVACYMAFQAAELGDPFASFGQRPAWNQEFTFPLLTFVNAAGAAGDGLLAVFDGHLPDDVYEFGFVCLACVATVGAFRRFPAAYGAYAAVALVMLLAYPIDGTHPSGFSRYIAPVFPVAMWIVAWSSERRLFRWVLAVSALLMAVNAARFATWHFVA